MGRRAVPRTAEIRIEAWAGSREQCIAEAVRAMVESFADTSGSRPTGAAEALIDPGTDEDMLVDVLDEAIYLVETAGLLPVGVEVEPLETGLRVRFQMTDADLVEPVGSAPKAVALHDLRFGPGPSGWSCTVTLDV